MTGQLLQEGGVYLVWLRDESRAMMARVFLDGGRLRLQPINPTLPPVFKKVRDVEFRGRVLKTIRVEKPVGNWPNRRRELLEEIRDLLRPISAVAEMEVKG